MKYLPEINSDQTYLIALASGKIIFARNITEKSGTVYCNILNPEKEKEPGEKGYIDIEYIEMLHTIDSTFLSSENVSNITDVLNKLMQDLLDDKTDNDWEITEDEDPDYS